MHEPDVDLFGNWWFIVCYFYLTVKGTGKKPIMYASGFFISLLVNFIATRFGLNITLVLSCFIGLYCCGWMVWGCKNDDHVRYEIYGLATLLGAAGSAFLIASLSIVSALIGCNSEASGFLWFYEFR